MTDLPYLDPAELHRLGYVQELNRRVLHPLGLSLEVVDEGGLVSIGGVLDYRHEPEGFMYGKRLDLERARFVESEWARRRPVRERALGWMVEPLPTAPGRQPTARRR